MQITFEDWLKDMFMESSDGRVNKDNCEDMFDAYLGNLDGEEWLRLGTVYGHIQFLAGEKKQIQERIDKLNSHD